MILLWVILGGVVVACFAWGDKRRFKDMFKPKLKGKCMCSVPEYSRLLDSDICQKCHKPIK